MEVCADMDIIKEDYMFNIMKLNEEKKYNIIYDSLKDYE
jgi:hypothetical protein